MHVVDFEIGLGIHYSYIMKETTEKAVNGSLLLHIFGSLKNNNNNKGIDGVVVPFF
jgi:hypothetical protein